MTRTGDVVDSVRHMILSGALRPGDRLLPEKELAAALSVSRGALREAVSALAALGVLDVRQGDGTFITTLEPELLLEPLGFVLDLHGDDRASQFLSVRCLLESEGASLAARVADTRALLAVQALVDEAENLHAQTVDHERLPDLHHAFHRMLLEASGNSVLVAVASVLTAGVGRFCAAAPAAWELPLVIEEHRGVLKAVASGDPERARLRMALHLFAWEQVPGDARSR